MAPRLAVAEWAPIPRVTVLTGAGISTDSGIPDFRGPNGVWTRDPAAEKLFTLDTTSPIPGCAAGPGSPGATTRPGPRSRARGTGRWSPCSGPGRLRAIVTQNIDGLHQRAGVDPGLIIEVHGTETRRTRRPGRRHGRACSSRRRRAGSGGLIWLGGSVGHHPVCDPFDLDHSTVAGGITAVVGTSLQVQPVASLVDVALATGARIVIVNAQPTPYDRVADVVLREPIGEVLPALVGSTIES